MLKHHFNTGCDSGEFSRAMNLKCIDIVWQNMPIQNPISGNLDIAYTVYPAYLQISQIQSGLKDLFIVSY
jgi:hypothetical protein